MKAMIVQTDLGITSALELALVNAGFNINIEQYGEGACETFRSFSPHLVVIDRTLPDIEGVALCMQLKELSVRNRIYTIMVMPRSNHNETLPVLQLGIDDVIYRPIDESELIARVLLAKKTILREEEMERKAGRAIEKAAELEERMLRFREEMSFLRETNRQVSELFFGLPTACFTYDKEGRIHEWNRACESLFGLSNTDINQGRIWDTVNMLNDEPRLKQMVNRVFEGERIEGVEWAGKCADGSPRHILYNSYPLKSSDGSVFGGISASMDITPLREAEHQMRLLSMAVENSMNAVLVMDADERLVYVNPAFESLSGWSSAEVIGEKPSEFLQGPMTDRETTRQLSTAMTSGSPVHVEMVNYNKDGNPYWISLRMAPVMNEDGKITHWVGLENDITQRRLSEEAIRDSEACFRSAITAMQDGLILIGADGIIRLANEAAERIMGAQSNSLTGRDFLKASEGRISLECADMKKLNPIQVCLDSSEPQNNVIMLITHPHSEQTVVSVNCAPLVHDGDKKPYSVVATLTDITERRDNERKISDQMKSLTQAYSKMERQQWKLKEANQKLEALAVTDGLTGLKNHRAFQERLGYEFDRARRYNTQLSLVILDVDFFKSYNDEFGHPAGDEVLKILGNILESRIRSTDMAARYGGEEFVVILPNTDTVGASAMAERFRKAFERRNWPNRQVYASFGVSTLGPATMDRKELIREADEALYHAKQNGRNRVSHYAAMVLEEQLIPEAA